MSRCLTGCGDPLVSSGSERVPGHPPPAERFQCCNTVAQEISICQSSSGIHDSAPGSGSPTNRGNHMHGPRRGILIAPWSTPVELDPVECAMRWVILTWRSEVKYGPDSAMPFGITSRVDPERPQTPLIDPRLEAPPRSEDCRRPPKGGHRDP